MATRPASYVCPSCAKGALTPEGTWATGRPAGGPVRRRRKRVRSRAVVRPPTHGAGAPPAQIRAELGGGGFLERDARMKAFLAQYASAPKVASSLLASSGTPAVTPPSHFGSAGPVASKSAAVTG